MSDEGAHWLWRLDAAGWLRAAEHELASADAHLHARKTALVHARRAAGMALNAVLLGLVDRCEAAEIESRWGRSYVDHLQAIAAGRHEPLPRVAIELAKRVLSVPLSAPELVALGSARGADVAAVLAAARELVALCRGEVPAV